LLSAVEGGIAGHAVTWLVTVPFCAVLLIGVQASYFWCVLCMFVISFFSILALSGTTVPFLYPAQWHAPVTMVGYIGLAVFLFLLAQIFEHGRVDAQAKMQQAYLELADATNQLMQANDELGLANKSLRHMNREKNEFIGIAAHDLKNPLAAIMGYAEILAMQEDQSLSRNQLFAGKISEAAERMLHLVTDMLDINAIEEGNKGLKQEEVNFGEVIPRMVAAHQMAADRKNIAIHFFPASRYLSRPIGRR
jgi:signal transduction histidine kinase